AGWQSTPNMRLLCGGEALPQDLAQRLRAGGGQLWNLYGPTEATIWASAHPVLDSDAGSVVPLGRPLPGTRLQVRDAHGRLSPIGVAGELAIAGPQLARGYLGRPDLTAERFVPDPFATRPGQRSYRSGDLARWRADGVLTYLGRSDQQVKLRGFRIEPGEIEAALRSCDGIREAAVVARADGDDRRLIAYLVGDRTLGADVLRTRLAARLPDYMLPAAYMFLDALPMTPNGKLDRRALPDPETTLSAPGERLPPANALERSLAKLWAGVLGPRRIGRDDHFFELGGHSLTALRLMTAAQRVGLPLTLQLIYACPTLRQQAECLLGGADAWGSRALAARRQGSRPPLFVLPTGIADIAYAFELAAHLDADVPIYALPWPDPLPATLEALAVQMVGMIQAVQPHGPYHLLGYSSGGLLAYAIAQHFGMHDQQVAFLGLLDCDYPEQAPDPMPLDEAAKQRLIERLETLLQDSSSDDAIQAACRRLTANAAEVSLQELAAQAEAEPALLMLLAQEQTSLEQIVGNCRLSAAYQRLWPTYWVQPLDPRCTLTVFHASISAIDDPMLGWSRLLPQRQIRTIAVPGNHVSMIAAEHLPEIGRSITAALSGSGAAGSAVPYEPSFTLQSARTAAPVVVCVPGAGDSVTGFIELSSALGETCSVVGMQPRGIDSAYPPYGSVELAAQHYLDALPKVASAASPLHLIGHSFGGWVVFEMALRLHALGRPPASLTLIDTRPPNRARVADDCKRDTIVDYFIDALQMRLRTPMEIDRQSLHALGQEALIARIHQLMVANGLMPARSRSDAVRGSLATFAHCCRTNYHPSRPYPGRLHLVLVANAQHAQQQADTYRELSEAWAAHTTDLRPWQGPGNHMTVLSRPHSQALAQWWMANVRECAHTSVALPPSTIAVNA
ncbi:alpha/beta fold hydrolase, partial [Xanthomonas maliensis]